MAHVQKPHFIFRLKGRVHLNRWGSQFSRLLAAVVYGSASVMLDTPRSEVVWEYWLPTPFASFPFTSPPMHHHVPPHSEHSIKRMWLLTLCSPQYTHLTLSLKSSIIYSTVYYVLAPYTAVLLSFPQPLIPFFVWFSHYIFLPQKFSHIPKLCSHSAIHSFLSFIHSFIYYAFC